MDVKRRKHQIGAPRQPARRMEQDGGIESTGKTNNDTLSCAHIS
jgi:hypothetical protein